MTTTNNKTSVASACSTVNPQLAEQYSKLQRIASLYERVHQFPGCETSEYYDQSRDYEDTANDLIELIDAGKFAPQLSKQLDDFISEATLDLMRTAAAQD